MSERILRAQAGTSLTLDEMRLSLPSIFAPDAHSSRSDRYAYISTQDMLERLLKGGFLPVEARSASPRNISRVKHAKHMLRFRGKDDLYRPDNTTHGGGAAYEVILRNSCDGSSSYQMLAGLIRFACANGLVVSDGTVATIRVLHTGDRKRVLDTILTGAQTVLEQGPSVADKIRTWRSIELHPPERTAYATAAHKLRFDPKGNIANVIVPGQLLLPRRPSDMGRSLWDVFNVVQENSLRGGLSSIDPKKHRRVTMRPINAIDDDLNLNRKLWELTERTAAIKLAGLPATKLEQV